MKLTLLGAAYCVTYCALCFAASAQAADFTTTDGYNATCSAMAATDAAALTNDDERVAFVLCSDTSLTKQIVAWADQGMKRLGTEKPSQQQIIGEVGKEIDYALERLAASREVLEKIHLGKRKSLRLVPSQWQLDLNGDGKTETWEKYFFAIPRRSDQPALIAMPNNEEAYYEREYRLDAAIRVDQSDVLWALSYHDFIEGLLSALRAYHVDEHFNFTLTQPALYRHAVDMYSQGFDNSEKTRQWVLAEKSNSEEWIANPKQTDSAFPIALDARDFVTWGKTIAELKALMQGTKLLGLPHEDQLPPTMRFCPAGFALDIHEFSLHPPASFGEGFFTQRSVFATPYCHKIDARHPLSSLPALMEQSQKDGTGLRQLRYLFWIN